MPAPCSLASRKTKANQIRAKSSGMDLSSGTLFGNAGLIFQAAARASGNRIGYLVWGISAGRLMIRYPLPSASDFAVTR